MQDEDGGGAVDQRGYTRRVFAGEQRPEGPNCCVDQDDPVGGGGDAVETVRTQYAQGLRNRQQAGIVVAWKAGSSTVAGEGQRVAARFGPTQQAGLLTYVAMASAEVGSWPQRSDTWRPPAGCSPTSGSGP